MTQRPHRHDIFCLFFFCPTEIEARKRARKARRGRR